MNNKNYNKNQRNTRGKTPRPNSNNKFDTRKESQDKSGTKSPTNDVSWYDQWPELTQGAGNLPMNRLPGTKLSLKQAPTFQVPGIMTFDAVTGIGWSEDQSSAVNVMANALYNYIRHVNSGHTNYDAPDLMMEFLAVTQLVSMHNWMRRLYGTIRLHSALNRYYPRALVEAQGFDYDDFCAHLADFRYYINEVAVKMATFVIPGTMPYVSRIAFMYSGLYADEMDEKAQIYLFKPAGFHKLDAYGPKGTSLKFMPIPNKRMKFAELKAYVDSFIAPLVANEDFAIMSGDILKAMGDSQIIHLPMTEEDYVVRTSYDVNVLSQISNAAFISFPLDKYGDSLNITQNPEVGGGAIKFTPSFAKTEAGAEGILQNLSHEVVLNFHDVGTDARSIIEATRLSMSVSENGNVVQLDGIGLEFLVGGHIWTTTDAGVHMTESMLSTNYGIGPWTKTGTGPAIDNVRAFLAIMQGASAFRYHPIIRAYCTGEAAPANGYMFLDWNNYTVVDPADLKRLHSAATYSLFTDKKFMVNLK